jgi:hypothetical protein
MDQELLEQFQIMLDAIERLSNEAEARIITRTEVLMETRITKRIDSLFDGYKLALEKQWELKHEADIMKEQISDLQVRLSNLESKIA